MEEKKELSLATPTEELAEKILTEKDANELNNVINLFNLNIKKKDLIRTGKLNDLQDKTLEQITKRIEQKPDEFSNKDLLDYYKTIQDTINKAGTKVEDVPNIQINQNILNVERKENSLDNESRKRVMDAVKSILNNTLEDDNVVDVDVKEKEEAEENG